MEVGEAIKGWFVCVVVGIFVVRSGEVRVEVVRETGVGDKI
jgi:hypothetical protein